MKRLFLILTFFSVNLFAQLPQNLPWLPVQGEQARVSDMSFDEITRSADHYFENKDISKKGSGYKPFKRWENHWEYYLTQGRNIAPASSLWAAWEAKKNMENSQQARSTQVVSNWESLGPNAFIDAGSWSSGQGRVNFLVVDPNNPNTYYLGAPAGGIWTSKDAGVSWTPLSDYLPQIGVSGIAIDPLDSNTIYITTGDDDAGDSYFVGVMKSTDGGQTWNNTGSISANSANEIYIDPTDSSTVWVATSAGLYKSMDGGAIWDLKKSGNIKDFKLKPGDPNVVYAVTSSSFYKSVNAGSTFTEITSGLPASSSRLTIDITPANPDYVYVLSAGSSNSFQGVYKSTNSGTSFSQTAEYDDIFNESGQAWYDLALGVSDIDAEKLFVGVLNIWKSNNGGDNFYQINNWSSDSDPAYTHADIHFLRYYNGVLFAGTDGGIYRSTDHGVSFENLTVGLAIGQFYRISVSPQSSQNIVGGLQDNGGFGYSNNTWYNYHGADGMDAAVNPINKNEYFGFIQFGGSLYKTTSGGSNGSYVSGAPANENGNWVTPLVANNNGILYAGYSQLYKLQDNTWVQVSNHSFGENLNNIEIDPNDNDIIYVSSGMNLYKSTDEGANFTSINTSSFVGNNISSIEVNNHDSNKVYVSTSGSSGKVYKSTDGGQNWVNISYNLPSESKNVVRHQKYNINNPLYVGTYLGVYYIDDTLSQWEVFSTNLPNSEVTDIEINPIDAKIICSTYGRGIWQSDIPTVLPMDDVAFLEVVNPTASVNCGDITPLIKVKNNGQNDITQIDVNYVLDGTSYSETWNGTLLSNENLEIPLNTFILNLGKHRINIIVNINQDTYSDNNSTMYTFYVNQLDPSPEVMNEFELATDNWLVITERTETGNLWERAEPNTSLLNTVSSGTQAYITNSNGNYTHNTVSDLYTPCYDLTQLQNPIMKFKMAFDIEEDWDVLYVQYSTNNGASWDVLGTASDPNWYTNSSYENALTIGGQWSGTISTLNEYSYDLSNFTTESQIVFRFHFASDPLENGEGVLIDDFVIEGTALSVSDIQKQQISIFPNPTQGDFTVKWSHDQEGVLKIYDLMGKFILAKTIEPMSEKVLSTKNLATGIYMLEFETSTSRTTKKLIIQ